MLRNRWVVILLAAGCVLVGFVVSFLIYVVASHDPYEAAIKATEQLLESAKAHSTGPLPRDELPSRLWVGEDCWALLQEAMLRNSGHYSLTARYNGERVGRPVDDIVVQADLDDRQIDVSVYEGAVDGCYRVLDE